MIDRLAVDLAELGAELDFPPTPDLAGAVVARLAAEPVAAPRRRAPRPAWRLATAAAILLAVVVVVGSLIPAVRDEVTAWLGIGGVEVERVDDAPDDLGAGLSLGEPITAEVAASALGRPLLFPAALGTPERTFLVEGGRAVSMLWPAGPDLPLAEAGVGAVLTQFAGTVDVPVVSKLAGPEVEIELIRVAGAEALWITGGPHPVFYLGPDGEAIEDSGRLAGNTLLWQVGPTTLRLESALDRDAAVALAESVA